MHKREITIISALDKKNHLLTLVPYDQIQQNQLSANTKNTRVIFEWFYSNTIWEILLGIAVPYVDNYAHISGFLAGLFWGYIYFSFIKKSYFQNEIK